MTTIHRRDTTVRDVTVLTGALGRSIPATQLAELTPPNPQLRVRLIALCPNGICNDAYAMRSDRTRSPQPLYGP